jgi:hypothetical protein
VLTTVNVEVSSGLLLWDDARLGIQRNFTVGMIPVQKGGSREKYYGTVYQSRESMAAI